MNVFTFCFVMPLSLIIFIRNFIKLLRSEKTKKHLAFSLVILLLSKNIFIMFPSYISGGFLFFVLFYQNGSLNGLSRYIFRLPVLYIFFILCLPGFKRNQKKYISDYRQCAGNSGSFYADQFRKIRSKTEFQWQWFHPFVPGFDFSVFTEPHE